MTKILLEKCVLCLLSDKSNGIIVLMKKEEMDEYISTMLWNCDHGNYFIFFPDTEKIKTSYNARLYCYMDNSFLCSYI